MLLLVVVRARLVEGVVDFVGVEKQSVFGTLCRLTSVYYVSEKIKERVCTSRRYL